MKIRSQPVIAAATILLLLTSGVYLILRKSGTDRNALAGSESCRSCHQESHKLWETSLHGRSLQPFTPEFAAAYLDTKTPEIRAESLRVEIQPNNGIVILRNGQGAERLTITHAVGGKNVFYFLTGQARGRLQTLPVAYDVRRREWFGTSGSVVRHFSGDSGDAPLPWTHRAYTFNTSCYRCHVSQASTHYDAPSDTYQLTWAEPGINCESCHGPAAEHVKVCRESAGKPLPSDLHIISAKQFSADQTNALCGSCHAKESPLTPAFIPGEGFFDHFDLATLDDPDLHPDGRDLGENYTFTSWRQSPCVQAGSLSCLHCHTSSGRFRFSDDPNRSCLPCHAERVWDVAAHSHHPLGSAASQCIHCHMPTTEFARMRRSDHSMLPPTPAATIAFGSPNACSLCHKDKSPEWADRHARSWYGRGYQDVIMHRAGLVRAARQGDWSRLDEMLTYILRKDRDEIVVASLLRLLRSCGEERKWPGIFGALGDSSPLVRAAAVQALEGNRSEEAVTHLMNSAGDRVRLVRIRAAASLADPGLHTMQRKSVDNATTEYMIALQARADDPTSHFNLGNFYLSRGQHARALASYRTVLRLEPQHVAGMVNASLACNALGNTQEAEQFLRTALEVDPANDGAWLNLGLLLAEHGRKAEAETALREALAADSMCDQAAYNLAVLISDDRLPEALEWSRKAVAIRPGESRYVYALVHYLRRMGRTSEGVAPLRQLLVRSPSEADAYGMLGEVLEELGKRNDAMDVYRKGARNADLPLQARTAFAERLRILGGSGK